MTNRNLNITINAINEKDANEQIAHLCINPTINSAAILMETNKGFSPDSNALIDAVESEVAKITKGDISAIEKMLAVQAYTLQNIFTDFMKKALSTEYLSNLQIYSKIALKAQSQCRQTLVALADIKNPNRTTFIKNTATNQQVNFNANSPEKISNQSNELLTGNNYAPMDITGKTTASGINQELATMEA